MHFFVINAHAKFCVYARQGVSADFLLLCKAKEEIPTVTVNMGGMYSLLVNV
jgi:hypothetical protein